MKSVKLNYHIPEDKDLLSFTAGLRPYRSEGIRLENQTIQGKEVYHNYGHGGGGLSLGWGCAKYLVEHQFLPSKPDRKATVAILGAGIIGLSTAVQLVEQGFNVKLYANNFAFDRKSNLAEITTTVAAGLWLPVKISSKTSLKDISLNTLNHFFDVLKQQNQSNTKLGISQMQCYIVNDKEEQMYSAVKGFIPIQPLQVTFNGQQFYDSVVFKTVIIETFFYIPYLMTKLQESGRFMIVERTLNSLEEVNSLEQKVIFNCLGLGSNKIFPDPCQMTPIKGHIARLPSYSKVMDFILFMKVEDRWVLQIPHKQRGIFNLGISFEQNKTDPEPEKQAIDLIMKTARDFYIKTTNNPHAMVYARL